MMKSLFLSLMALLFLIPSQASPATYYHLEGKIGNEDYSVELIKEIEEGEDYYRENIDVYLYAHKDLKISYLNYFFYEKGKTYWELEEYTDLGEHDWRLNGRFDGQTFKGTGKKDGKEIAFEFLVKTNPNKFETFTYAYRDSFFKGEGGLTYALDIDNLLPSDVQIKKEFVRLLSENEFDDFQRMVDKLEKETKTLFDEEVKSYLEISSGIDDDAYVSRNQFSLNIFPVLSTQEYIVLKSIDYEYMGGAHGYASTEYYTYSHQTKKWLKTEDVFNLIFQDELTAIIDQEIHILYEIPMHLNLLGDEKHPTGFNSETAVFSSTFTLDKTGVTFYYDPYILTPYAAGVFQIHVPYEKLKPYMNKDFKF